MEDITETTVIDEGEDTSEETESWGRLQPGDTIIHKSLGPGIIMVLDDNYIIVKFRDRESKFLYPGAFEKGYLSTER